MLANSTLKFLKDLKKNNNKPWFDDHRKMYEEAKNDFENFVQQLIDRIAKKDDSIKGMKAKEGMFRINRDVRFSKDKSPYKTNFGASIKRGGKKSAFAGYYFHLEPGEAFAGGGLWQPDPADLKKIRQEVDYCLDEFRGIVESRKFRAVYGGIYRGEDASLTKVPQGFDKENPAAEFLKLKSYLALRKLTDRELTSPDLVKISVDAFETLIPLLGFINRSVGPEHD